MTDQEIRTRRLQLRLTQEQLAERFGVSANTISRWESGAIEPEAKGMLSLAFDALEWLGDVASLPPETRQRIRRSQKMLKQSARELKKLMQENMKATGERPL